MGWKSAELSEEAKDLIVTLAESVHNKAELSRLLNIPRTTITSVLKKHQQTGSVKNKKRSGRKKTFTARDKTALIRLTKANRRLNLQEITAKLNEAKTTTFSTKTVQRALHSEGYRRRVIKKKVLVRQVNQRKRVKWCKDRKNFTVNDYWKQVIFSDESQVVLGKNNHYYIWR